MRGFGVITHWLVLAIAAVAVGGCDPELLPVTIDAPWICGCQYGQPALAGAITPDKANEVSGLAASAITPDTIWAHTDGNNGKLFALTTFGAGKGIAVLPNANVVDWEDIAVAPCGGGSCIYLADTGDNTLTRTAVQIYEVDEPGEFRGMMEVTYRIHDITYPDGPHDAEALFVDPRDGASYVITKQDSNPSTVFLMPRTQATATAVAVATFTVPSGDTLVTAADLRADECGVRLLIRTYSSLFELAAPAGTSIVDLFATAAITRPVAVEPQGESVAFLPSGHAYLTVSDGPSPTISRVRCE